MDYVKYVISNGNNYLAILTLKSHEIFPWLFKREEY